MIIKAKQSIVDNENNRIHEQKVLIEDLRQNLINTINTSIKR